MDKARLTGALVASLAVVVLVTGPADQAYADANFSTSVEPSVVGFPATRALVYRLQITSDAAGASFNVTPRAPDWLKGRYQPFVHVLGSPIGMNGLPTYEGAGKMWIVPNPGPVASIAPVPETGPHVFRVYKSICWRGYSSTAGYFASVELPPSSEAVLSFPYRTGAAPPWQGTNYALGFEIRPSGGSPLELYSPQPEIRGRAGTVIDMSVLDREPLPNGRLGVLMRGETSPPLRRKPLKIRLRRLHEPSYGYYPRARSLRLLRRVKTDARGKFRVRLAAKHDAYYTVAAFYQSHDPSLASDSSCALVFHAD
jgi:hypothetical protein